VDQWLETAAGIVSGAALESQCVALNDYLTLRTFLVGYGLTVADLAVWGQLQGERLGWWWHCSLPEPARQPRASGLRPAMSGPA
jgi:hypothetical protein